MHRRVLAAMHIPLGRLAAMAVLIFQSGLGGLFWFGSAQALSGSDFRPGRIIDNAIFYNRSAMSVDQIQQFLNARVPVCDTNGTKPSENGGGTRAQYGASQGYPAPYTCVRDYWQNPTTGEDNYGGKPTPAGAQSAAQIIWNAAQQYNVNPQVLLVLIQKEAIGNILGDEWPWPNQYRTATGFGCPDNGPNNTANCNAQYYGFANQVTLAAKQFRLYANNPGNYNFLPSTTNFIQWSPNASCGGANVYIENQATASLYDYTPYQPNQAALKNLYATGDGCSAYGNRNFWRIFTEWFGNTTESADELDRPDSQRSLQTVEFNSQIYTFYYDSFQRVLRVATQNISTGVWEYTVIDGSSKDAGGRIDASLGSGVTVTTLANSLQVYYYDKTNGDLRHGWKDSNGWHFETLDGDAGSISHQSGDVGANPSVTTLNGSIQLFYYDRGQGNMRHAWADATGWHFENLDGDAGSLGHLTTDTGLYSTVSTFAGFVQLYYYDRGQGNLRHAWTDATGWHFENLDGDVGSIARQSGDVGLSPSMTIVGSSIQLFYYDRGQGNLRHAWSDATGWHFENLDGDVGSIARLSGDVGINSSVSSFGGSIQLFYYDRGQGNLRHAWANTTGWHFEDLDGTPGSIGRRNGDTGVGSTVTPFSNSLQLYYYDRTSGNLRHSWSDTTGWHFEDLGPLVIY